jgi:tetratricopeptide (TPR) repeat protein
MNGLAPALFILFQSYSIGASPGPFSADDIKSMRAIMGEIYRIDYQSSSQLCRQIMAKSPADPLGYVFMARTLWQQELSRNQALALNRFAAPDFFVEKQTVKYKLQPNPETQAEFERVSQAAIAKSRERVKASPEDLRAWFLLGLAYQNLATFNASLQGSWRKAFFAGETTRRAHQRVHARYPGFSDALVSLGVYEYVAGSVNWFYRLWGSLVGISGDRRRGLANLDKAAREAAFLAGDAKSMLVLIYTRERNYQMAFNLLSELRRDYPENYFVPMDQGTLALRMNRPAEAISIYGRLLEQVRAGTTAPGFEAATALNQLGIAHRMKGDLTAAAGAFEKALAAGGSSARARAIAHLELGKTLDLQGRRADALRRYQEAMALEDVMGSREEAGNLVERPYRGR